MNVNLAVGVYGNTQQIFSSDIPDAFYTRYLRQPSVTNINVSRKYSFLKTPVLVA
jgi:hypothetical protein